MKADLSASSGKMLQPYIRTSLSCGHLQLKHLSTNGGQNRCTVKFFILLSMN